MNKDKVKEFLLRLYSNIYVKTITRALAIIVGVLLVIFIYLYFFTRHGQSYPIPDFRGLNQVESAKLAKKFRLRTEVVDSVFIVTKKPGTVIEQSPAAGLHIKQNRKIFLTINARNPKKVDMPDILNLTLRQAKAILDQKGINIGTLTFVPDIAVNNILKQKMNGKDILPGTMVPKGSKVDLVLGRGMGSERTGLPLLVGLKLYDARNLLIDASLNLGQVNFDETIKNYKDSLDAMVYSQYPAYYEETPIYFGAKVDLWLTLNESRIPVLKNTLEGIDSTYLKIDTAEIEEVIE